MNDFSILGGTFVKPQIAVVKGIYQTLEYINFGCNMADLPVIKDILRLYEEGKATRDNPVYVWILTVLYILFVYLGPKFMKNRKPFQFQAFMVIYNLGLVALSVYMFVESRIHYISLCSKTGYKQKLSVRKLKRKHIKRITKILTLTIIIILSCYDIGYFKQPLCAPYNEQTRQNPKELRLANVLWWYFFSKALEFMDTIMMILRKKNNQVTFLHVFHHTSMLNFWWWVMVYNPGGQSWFSSSLNCSVHIVMYLYYALSAIPSLREKLWWKKYITKFQLSQFILTLFHTVQTYMSGCDFPVWGQFMLTAYMIILLVLFSNFYLQTYIKNKQSHVKKTDDRKYTNGVSDGINGYSKQHTNGTANGYAKVKSQ
ncbi:hypothetical protein KUTeg_017098 [Tegillarca granosa]|uniref:Elongation of very long chain fatty acids protein n=1 Tax=Tegillarca granosa TaxID=220873 RepID=A0ABQ9ETC6_TEGGR|nr:hypothetical protein KUTeg_017098 [Tegillarca granosa]